MSLLDTLLELGKENVAQKVSPVPPVSPETSALLPLAGMAERPCLHCGGSGECNCFSCGRYQARLEWTAGRCQPCEVRKGKLEQVH